MKKTVKCLCCIFVLLFIFSSNVFAVTDYPVDAPYETYIYNSDTQPVVISSAFTVEKVVKGKDFSDSSFKNLNDIFYSSGRIFICDTDNDRILVSDTDFTASVCLSEFDNNGTKDSFNRPQGIWANEKHLYVADTDNHRIVLFEYNETSFKLKKVYDRPDIKVLEDDYVYSPTGLTVDATGKMYVIAENVNQGLICLDEQGIFQSFLGAPQVELNIFETLWRKVATKEQLAKMESYVPTEYNAITMDSYGFLYVASQTSNSVPVGKLNSDGDNVLVPPKAGSYGDLEYLKNDGSYAPYFTDVAINTSGRIGEDTFYLIDSKQGKIYAYTEDGYLLYAFGLNGDQQGSFYNASAIEYIPASVEGAGRLLVTDSFKGTITVLKETDFAVSIRKALYFYNIGDYENSKTEWEKVQNISSNYTLASIGLSRIELQAKDYKSAMNRLMTIRERKLYSDAFENWRDGFLREYFLVFFFGILGAVIVIFVAVKLFRKSSVFSKLEKIEIYQGYKYSNYVMLHPFDGFWDLKHEKRGNIKSASVIAVLFFVIYALRAQFGGYVVTGTVTEEVNALYNVSMIFLPLLFYIISNWCFTTLMDGKGTMKDIYIATCYALKPYVFFGLPMLILSNVLTESEAVFYVFFDMVILAWTLFLLFASLMMTHDYSLGKTLLTIVLILIGICLIIFILLLVINIVQNIYQYIYNIYQELSFRSY